MPANKPYVDRHQLTSDSEDEISYQVPYNRNTSSQETPLGRSQEDASANTHFPIMDDVPETNTSDSYNPPPGTGTTPSEAEDQHSNDTEATDDLESLGASRKSSRVRKRPQYLKDYVNQ